MLDAGEHPGWVQKMMGHETMQMIYEKYYSYIKNYERDEGSAFMERVFNSTTKIDSEDPKLSQMS
jgi:integrase